jgi:hypothetical protein
MASAMRPPRSARPARTLCAKRRRAFLIFSKNDYGYVLAMQLADDVLAFLRDVPAAPFCPLSPEDAVRVTQKLWARASLAEAMGLVVLNDTDDSDHYCLATRGPAAGAVMFLPHDDGAEFAFPNLRALHDAMVRAASEGTEIWDVEPAPPTPHPDQPALREHLRACIASDGDDTSNVVSMLLPLLDPEDIETLRLLATDRDFLVRECVACFMARAPRQSHLPLLEALISDDYPQVQRPARTARSALSPTS